MVSFFVHAVATLLLASRFSEPRPSVNVQFQLTEECPPGTVVGRLSDDASFHISQFRNNPPNSDLFQLLTVTKRFAFDSYSGTITTKNRIDREEICQPSAHIQRITTNDPSESPCSIDLQILRFLGQESDAVEPQVILVKIFILDINDNSPTWQENTINLTIPEHTPLGTRFPLPTALDADCGPENTTSKYFIFTSSRPDTEYGGINSLTPGISRLFQLDTEVSEQRSSQNFLIDRWANNWNIQNCRGPTFRLWLQVVGELDYESSSRLNLIQQKQVLRNEVPTADSSPQTYVLKLAAVDGNRIVPKTGSVTIRVNVIDINDQAPYFVTPEHSSVEGVNANLKDDGSSRGKPLVIEVQENAPFGQSVYTPFVVEPDVNDRANLVFSFDSSTSSAARTVFGIREKDGTIFLKQSPDYETQASYTLPIVVSDGKHRDVQELRIDIVNINDHAPTITVRPVKLSSTEGENLSQLNLKQHQQQQQHQQPLTRYKPIYLEVDENRPPGYYIATVLLTDRDQRGSSVETSGDGSMAFQCHLSHDSLSLEPLYEGIQSQFKLVTHAVFDREQTGEIFIALTCHDSGTPRQTSRVDIKLTILDKNDNRPVFKHNPIVVRVNENSPIGMNVTLMEAFDADDGVNAALVYTLNGDGAEHFKIDPHTGLVTTAAAIDRELTSQFHLIVTVKDRHGIDSGSGEPINEESVSLAIEVLDENDCSPEFEKPIYQFWVDENAKVNTLVGEIKAQDNDATSENNKIRYFLKDEIMNQANLDFRVSADGRVLVARETLDRETTNMYFFTIVAVDSGKHPLSTTTQAQIHIGDINDNAPNWLFPPESNSVMNLTIHEPVGQQVAQLRASDPDLGENGQVIFKIVHFLMLSNNVAVFQSQSDNYTESELSDQEIFDLDSSTGALYLARPLKPSDMGLVKLLIEASDMGRPNKTNHRTILFHILDFQRPNHVNLGSNNNRFGTAFTAGALAFQNQDLVVIIVMVAVAVVISLFLIVAILFLRCPICFVRDTAVRNYSHESRNRSGIHANYPPLHTEAYYPGIFRDSHVVGGGKEDSLKSNEDHWLYPAIGDKIIPSSGSISGKNIFTVDYDGSLQQMTLSQYHQDKTFKLLTKPDGAYSVARDGTLIELNSLNTPAQSQKIPKKESARMVEQHQIAGAKEMRPSQSTSCLSAFSSGQRTVTPTAFRSENDSIEDVNKVNGHVWIPTSVIPRADDAHLEPEIARNTRAYSPQMTENVCCTSEHREKLCLLSPTCKCSLPTGTSPTASDVMKDNQRYAVLVSPIVTTTPSCRVAVDHLRYVEVPSVPTHDGSSSKPVGKKTTPTVSWRSDTHELRTYSPDVDPLTMSSLTCLVDQANGYAQLDKDAEANVTLPYDQLVHRFRNDSGSFSDFSSGVI